MTGLGWLALAAAVLAGFSAGASEYRRRRSAARVARAGHELRGALSTLSLGLALAQRRPLRCERARALELQVRRAAIALEDLSASAAQPLSEPVDVGELIQDSVEALRPLAAGSGSELRVLPGPPAIVSGVRGRLAQALGNLIQNAIEHGKGPVSVQATVGEGSVRLEVLDQGPGIARPLVRLHHRAHHGRRGHGLAVAAAVASSHGGRLLSAPSDQGARLVLELPLVSAQQRARAATGRGS